MDTGVSLRSNAVSAGWVAELFFKKKKVYSLLIYTSLFQECTCMNLIILYVSFFSHYVIPVPAVQSGH